MIILGIDPGTARMGWGIVTNDSGKAEYVDCGCLETSSDSKPQERLETLFSALKDIIEHFEPDILAVEDLYFAQNVKTAFAVGQAKGVVMLAAAQVQLPIFEYTPLQVKQAITGYVRDSKEQIQQMVVKELGLSKIPQPDDAADGLAIALTHCYTNNRLGT
jgi:crossover junction endodeoxyribonuclease RuvC